MPETLVETDDFQAALGYAKALARKNECDALQVGHIAAGFAMLISRSEGVTLSWLIAAKEQFLTFLQKLEPKADNLAPLAKTEKLPIDKELQQLIKNCGSSLDEFGKCLLEWIRREDVFALTPVQQILRRSSVIAKSAGAASIDAETFCAGAYALYLNGQAKDWPLLSAIMGANVPALQAIVNARGFLLPEMDGDYALPIDYSFQSAVLKSGERREPLLRVLNVGLKTGSDILARERTAYHEAGHAVASYVLRPRLTVTHLTNITEGDASGATYYDREAPFWNRITADDVPVALCVSLAGRTCEQIKYGRGQADDGAVSDIEHATRIAWNAICELGLDDEFGCIHIPSLLKKLGQPSGFLFDEAQRSLQRMLKQASCDARSILEENWALVEATAQALIVERTMSGESLLKKLLIRSLEGAPNAVVATSLPVEREVRFADAPGILDTNEGPVRYLTGDAIVSDHLGGTWPVSRAIFEKTYKLLGAGQAGAPGVYQKIPRKVWAQRLSNARRLDMSDGRGVMHGCQGDWIVDYGQGDLAIVNANAFIEAYKVQ